MIARVIAENRNRAIVPTRDQSIPRVARGDAGTLASGRRSSVRSADVRAARQPIP